jgi:hypothetical protein
LVPFLFKKTNETDNDVSGNESMFIVTYETHKQVLWACGQKAVFFNVKTGATYCHV